MNVQHVGELVAAQSAVQASAAQRIVLLRLLALWQTERTEQAKVELQALASRCGYVLGGMQ